MDHQIEQNPRDADLYIKRGRIQRDTQQFTRALDDYHTALKLAPNSPKPLYWQADIYFLQKEYKKSRDTLKKYLKTKSQSPLGHHLLAKTYVQLGLAKEAAKHFNLAVKHNKNAPPQWYLDKANTLLAIRPLPLKLIEQSITEGIQKHGELINFVSFMIRTHKSAKNYSTALSWVKRLPVQSIGTPYWKNQHADILVLAGKTEEALSLYRSVVTQIASYSYNKKRLPAFIEENDKAKANIRRLENLSVQAN